MKNKLFILGLIIIYLVFLAKDSFFKFYNNWSSLNEELINIKDSFYKNEYVKLNEMLKLEAFNYEIVYSKMIFRDIYNFYDEITITKGSNDDIKVGNIVLNESGVIGVIKSVKNNYSEVFLLTNPEVNISVKVNDTYGILEGRDKRIVVKNIKDAKVNIGDVVTTSGLTDIPEGLVIGKVKNIEKDNLDLEFILEIEPSVNINYLNYVGVVKS